MVPLGKPNNLAKRLAQHRKAVWSGQDFTVSLHLRPWDTLSEDAHLFEGGVKGGHLCGNEIANADPKREPKGTSFTNLQCYHSQTEE